MNILFKPNGTQVSVNDNSLSYALSIGWTKEDPTAKPEPKKQQSKKAR